MTNDNSKRNEQIVEMRLKGMSYREIGKKVNLSHQGVQQIYKKATDPDYKPKRKKRSTLHIDADHHEALMILSKLADLNFSKYIKAIVNDLLDGKYDYLLKPKGEEKGLAIDREDLRKATEYLKDYKGTVTDFIKAVLSNNINEISSSDNEGDSRGTQKNIISKMETIEKVNRELKDKNRELNEQNEILEKKISKLEKKLETRNESREPK